MAETLQIDSPLPGDMLAALEAAGPVEVLIGIPALNHARSVVRVLEQVGAGLVRHFSGEKSAILVVDAGSQDGTLETVQAWRDAVPAIPAMQELRFHGPAQRGQTLLAILLAARRLQASACAFVDADLISVMPEWVEQLLRPILRGEADFVIPIYSRAVSEGTLTTNLLAPMMRSLYGRRIQQPMGGCAGLSRSLVERLLGADIWASDLAVHGLDLWMTTEALVSGAQVVETHVGHRRVHPVPGQADLATTVVRVMGPLFDLMERYQSIWEESRGSVPLPLVGGPAALLPPAGDAPVDRMVRAFRMGLKDLLPIWEQIMEEETLGQLYPLGFSPVEEFLLPPPVWARVISDFAVAYHERRLPRDHLLRALTSLYLGRVAAFLVEARAAPPSRLPDILEAIGRAFEAEKDFLRARWR
jgi:hypothetical protein